MSDLGSQLLEIRQMKDLSLNSVAKDADISPAYLQKLERGLVKTPSPPVLLRLAKALDVSYTALMEAAGYLESKPERPGEQRENLLAQALKGEKLTPKEAEQLASYLSFIRKQRSSR